MSLYTYTPYDNLIGYAFRKTYGSYIRYVEEL